MEGIGMVDGLEGLLFETRSRQGTTEPAESPLFGMNLEGPEWTQHETVSEGPSHDFLDVFKAEETSYVGLGVSRVRQRRGQGYQVPLLRGSGIRP